MSSCSKYLNFALVNGIPPYSNPELNLLACGCMNCYQRDRSLICLISNQN